jgi:hypothetical protein
MNLPRSTFLHLAAGTAAVGSPARPVRIIVGTSSAPDHEKKWWGKPPSFDPVGALPPPAVAFSTNQYQPRAFAMFFVQALVTVVGNQLAQTICGKAACRD